MLKIMRNFYTPERCEEIIESYLDYNKMIRQRFHHRDDYGREVPLYFHSRAIDSLNSTQWIEWWEAEYPDTKNHAWSVGTVFNEMAYDHGIPKHRDHRTFNVVTVLNDDFDGGEFIIWDDKGEKHEIDGQTGTVILFPDWSHAVNTITDGVRYSVIEWITDMNDPEYRKYQDTFRENMEDHHHALRNTR